MKIFWLESENLFEIKLLDSDNDVLEVVIKLTRNHYVHVYLEEVLTASNVANVELEINVEVSDAGSFEPEVSDDAGTFEPKFNVEVSDDVGSFEPEFNVEVSDITIVSDDDSLKENIGEPEIYDNVSEPSEIRVESNFDS
ncbi:hypothetical protein V6N11_035362 [Hibiscus sabdariffa]|uniref:Uncharacterized protein n=1 Tax=Hibiscus sabdariffa TaxID=183260 RepID=A0ABR2R0J2_9ROSI